jgi:hypothetical protein
MSVAESSYYMESIALLFASFPPKTHIHFLTATYNVLKLEWLDDSTFLHQVLSMDGLFIVH